MIVNPGRTVSMVDPAGNRLQPTDAVHHMLHDVIASDCARTAEGGSARCPLGITTRRPVSPGGYGTIDAPPTLRLNVAIALLDTDW